MRNFWASVGGEMRVCRINPLREVDGALPLPAGDGGEDRVDLVRQRSGRPPQRGDVRVQVAQLRDVVSNADGEGAGRQVPGAVGDGAVPADVDAPDMVAVLGRSY